MIKSYIKIGVRNLIRNKIHSFINIFGLALGMSVAFLIGLWIYDELSFNKYHENYDRIAEVKANVNYDGRILTIDSHPFALGEELRLSFSDFKYVVVSTATVHEMISFGENTFTQTGRYMQSEATTMLSLEMISGTKTALIDPQSIMISVSLANKLFGNIDPLNKIIKINEKLNVTVAGVYRDLPWKSQFRDVTFIAALDLYISSNEWITKSKDDWSNQWAQIYTQILPNLTFENVSSKIKNVKLNHLSGEQAARRPLLFLHPMQKWHLYSKFENGVIVTSEQMKLVFIYGIIGIFVLVLACINYINLSTARSEKRAKEVGLRKVIGSSQKELIIQFLGESILVAALAFVLCLGLLETVLPKFNVVSGKGISIQWNEPLFWLVGIGFTLITGLLAGIYPAFYLSTFSPLKVLKGSYLVGRFATLPRKILVVFQFIISITLILVTVVIYRQIQFAQDRPIGYSREGLLSFDITSSDFQSKFDVIRNELLNTGIVTEVAESSSPITTIWSTSKDFDWQGKVPDTHPEFGIVSVSIEYGKTVGWEVIDGRDFSPEFVSDSSGLMINETLFKLMGLKNPVGLLIKHNGKNYRILGVIKDMVMESPFKPSFPTVFLLDGNKNAVLIKILANLSEGNELTKIESALKKLFPTSPVVLGFVTETYASKFAPEERLRNMVFIFGILAIIISCIGLFGLSSYLAEKRTKEIGIRKVLGASINSVWYLLASEFIGLIIISFFVAIPISYYFMHNWLQNYQYKIGLSWWIFAVTGIFALIITFLTVSFQAIRAASLNPVMSLQSE